MNRRTFLRRTATAAAAAVVAPRALTDLVAEPAAPELATVTARSSGCSSIPWPPDALVAAGGLCAPITPIYDFPALGSPARDALAREIRTGR